MNEPRISRNPKKILKKLGRVKPKALDEFLLLKTLAKYKIACKTSPKGTHKKIKVLKDVIEVDNQDLNDFEGDVRDKKMKAQGQIIESSSRERRSKRLKSKKGKNYKEESKQEI